MGVIQEAARQAEILSRGTAEILPVTGLQERIETALREDRPLRVKLGIDPTTADVHIGHMVPYRKLRQFQDLGHTAVLIIGDFTATIGDPSGKNKERPRLSHEHVRANAETYCEQIFKVIDRDRAEIHYQSEWFSGAGLRDAIELCSRFSVAHLLTHETFRSRLENGGRLGLHELMYPLLQAQDSIEVYADIELGGMDQKFNILCGRDLQKNLGQSAQCAMFLPLLPGPDGLKMSKTGGNHIAVMDSPEDMYGRVMSVPDSLLDEYLDLAADRALVKDVLAGAGGTDVRDAEGGTGAQAAAGAAGPARTTVGGKADSRAQLAELVRRDPYRLKKAVAAGIVTMYHGKAAAARAAGHFSKTVSRGDRPDSVPVHKMTAGAYLMPDLLCAIGAAGTRSEARRLISGCAVRIDGEKCCDPLYDLELKSGAVVQLQVGKRRWFDIAAG